MRRQRERAVVFDAQGFPFDARQTFAEQREVIGLHDERQTPVKRRVSGMRPGVCSVFVLTILFFQLPSLWTGAMLWHGVNLA
ncbi:hypothetical protein PanNE5_33290 [Pandoraea sp. NE5]|nr:hypothetical protein PanNE5_33290 [Pandoraea sp. NE5]